MALTLIAVWFLISETHRGQQLTPALTLPQGCGSFATTQS
jgi:hypothetical protein